MNETEYIENYLTDKLSFEDRLLMEARLLIDTDLKEKVMWQQRTYELIKVFGRKQLKAEIEKVHERVFSENRFHSFRQKINNIFK